MSMFIWPLVYGPGFHLCTYDQQTGNVNDVQNQFINLDEFELSWIWFYFGYSSRRQKAYAVIKVLLTGETYELTWPGRQHFKKAEPLRFELGGSAMFGSTHGRYFDVRVDYGKGSYFGNLEDINAYFLKYVPQNPALPYQNKLHKQTLIDNNEVWTGRTQRNEDLIADRRWKFAGEQLEYAVHGWMQWIDWKPDTWNNLIRVTYSRDGNQGNADKIGDRDLALWVGPGYFHYTTSTYSYNGGDNWNVVQNIDYGADIGAGKWIYIYFGYSRVKQKVFGYVKFEDREASVSFTNIRHQVPGELWVFLGKDYWHSGVNGKLRNWEYLSGPGAYKDSDMNELYEPTATLVPTLQE